MLWIILSLMTALAVAVRDISVKSYSRGLKTFEIAVLELLWSLPLFALGFLLVPVPDIKEGFWQAFFISIPLNTVPYLLYILAIRLSPISLTVPFLSFTPVFMIFTGFVILGESINIWGGIGILLIVAGSYVLNYDKTKKGFFKPLAALFHEKGSWIMLIVAFLYSFAAVIGKKAIVLSSALYFSYFFFTVFNSLILLLLFIVKRESFQVVTRNKAKGVWLGGLFMSHLTTHGLAIAISTAVYMIAIKRCSILISVLLGFLILKETDIKSRGLGAILMFCGALLITLFG